VKDRKTVTACSDVNVTHFRAVRLLLAEARIQIGPIEAIDDTPVVDVKVVLDE
jgi:tRNA (Thr-GGU) A37 N-methylase